MTSATSQWNFVGKPTALIFNPSRCPSTSYLSFARHTTELKAHTTLWPTTHPSCTSARSSPSHLHHHSRPSRLRRHQNLWLRQHHRRSIAVFPSSLWLLPLHLQQQETARTHRAQILVENGECCCPSTTFVPLHIFRPLQSYFAFHYSTQYTIYPFTSLTTLTAIMSLGAPPKHYLSNHAVRPRRANGATQTFRRPSHAPTLSGSTTQSTSRDASVPLTSSSANPGVYVPPHAQFGRNGSSAEGRYSRDQLLQLFHAQRESEDTRDGMSSLYVGGWEPNVSNGTSSATWGRRDDPSREAQSGVDLCWDRDGSTLPMSLSDMTEEEKEVCQFHDQKVFATSNIFLA